MSNLNLSDLILQPKQFFQSLRELPPKNTRFLWLAILAGLISIPYVILSQQSVNSAMIAIPSMSGMQVFNNIGIIISAPITYLLVWLSLWGLGSLGVGKDGRPAEVYSVTFITSMLASLLITPLVALFPVSINVPAPHWGNLDGAELQKAIQKYSILIQSEAGKNPISVVTIIISYIATAWQFYLAWIGFNIIQPDRSKAIRGVLIPLSVFVFLGIASLVLSHAISSMVHE